MFNLIKCVQTNKGTERVRKAVVTLNVIKTKRHQIGFSV